MTKRRYWLTYTGVFTSDDTDEEVLAMQALVHHHERLQDESKVYGPAVEVEQEGDEGQ